MLVCALVALTKFGTVKDGAVSHMPNVHCDSAKSDQNEALHVIMEQVKLRLEHMNVHNGTVYTKFENGIGGDMLQRGRCMGDNRACNKGKCASRRVH